MPHINENTNTLRWLVCQRKVYYAYDSHVLPIAHELTG